MRNTGGLLVRSYYDLTVEAAGFVKTTLCGIFADPARETSVPQVKLQLATVTQTVEVSAEVQGVDTASAEVADTVSMEQIMNLPIMDRDVLSILQTQPSVASNGNSYTGINGLRTSYSNMTLDGINIQDNYIRDKALRYTNINSTTFGVVSYMFFLPRIVLFGLHYTF